MLDCATLMQMSMTWDIFKEFFPTLKDSVKNGFDAFKTTKQNRQDIFVLKAIARMPDCHWIPPAQYPRYDLCTIANNIRMAQYEEALRLHDGGDMGLFPTPEEEQEFVRELKTVERRYGLPGVRDPERDTKVEEILHRMVRCNKLRFHPPNTWSIV
jgi:hypothetical protein